MPQEDVFNRCSARRTLLLGASAMGIAVLTGCGGGDDTPSGAAGGPGGSSAPAAPATTGGNPFDDSGPSGGAGAGQVPGNALVAVGEVPVGGGVIVKDTVLVLQPTKGAFKAYNAACPHEGAIVDPPFGGNAVIQCPRHNSKFKVADGTKISGPTPSGLKGVKVSVKNGYVVQA